MTNSDLNSTSKFVLLIDDDPEILELLSIRFELLGLVTRTATNVLEATKIMDQRTPDLMLVDIEMPFTNGLTFLQRLAEDPEAQKIPAIVLTGHKNMSTIERVDELCAYYVHKSPDAWPRIETFTHELIEVEAN